MDNGSFEDEFKEYDECVSSTRRPLVLIVGKPLSQEEVKTLIINEEPIFQMWDDEGRDSAGVQWVYDENLELVNTDIDRGYCGTLRNIVHRKGFCWLDGWVFCDGTIYGSFNEFKYPQYEEYIDKWKQLARRNPFVDMVVAYTDIDEWPCSFCEGLTGGRSCFSEHHKGNGNKQKLFYEWNGCKYGYEECLLLHLPQTRIKAFEKERDRYKGIAKREYENAHERYERLFYEQLDFWIRPRDIHRCVQIVLHIHDGIVETLCGEAAKKYYTDYDKRYGDFRLWIAHNSSFYDVPADGGTDKDTVFIKFDDEYLRSCFRYMGLSESIYDEQIKPGYLIDIKAKKKLVTREWLISEYEKHFKGTELDIENVNAFYGRFTFGTQ